MTKMTHEEKLGVDTSRISAVDNGGVRPYRTGNMGVRKGGALVQPRWPLWSTSLIKIFSQPPHFTLTPQNMAEMSRCCCNSVSTRSSAYVLFALTANGLPPNDFHMHLLGHRYVCERPANYCPGVFTVKYRTQVNPGNNLSR